MKKIVAANWKMNPPTAEEAEEIVGYLLDNYQPANNQLIVFPPFLYFCNLRDKFGPESDRFDWGAQDISWSDNGALTGEISPAMLKSFWVEYVIVGHSERRWKLGETDEVVNKKLKAALNSGIIPVLAVGEREKGDFIQDVLIDQLTRGLEGVSSDEMSKVIIAYEPVWAIGTGSPDNPDDTVKAVGIIKDVLAKLSNQETADNIPVLYGGSIDENNVADFLGRPEINGALIGGASIRKEEFLNILNIVEKL